MAADGGSTVHSNCQNYKLLTTMKLVGKDFWGDQKKFSASSEEGDMGKGGKTKGEYEDWEGGYGR